MEPVDRLGTQDPDLEKGEETQGRRTEWRLDQFDPGQHHPIPSSYVLTTPDDVVRLQKPVPLLT